AQPRSAVGLPPVRSVRRARLAGPDGGRLLRLPDRGGAGAAPGPGCGPVRPVADGPDVPGLPDRGLELPGAVPLLRGPGRRALARPGPGPPGRQPGPGRG